MEIVTGKAGVPHVSSADDGRRIAGEVGTGSYVLQTGGKLAPSLVDANTVRIATGDMIVQGRHIGVTAPEDVKVASGSQGKKRMDYICVHYTRDVSGSSPTLVETVEWKVLQGTPGSSAAAPSVPKGSILDGDADVTVPICSVTFDGLTTGQPKLLIPELTPLADLGDSVSRRVVGQTSTGKLYQPFRCDLPSDRMAALVCIYDNGRPLASTVFPISIFARYCTGAGVCADCYYSPGGFGVHAYYTGGILYLMADANIYKAAFVVF